MANKLIIKALVCATISVVLAVMPFAAISQSNLPEIDSLTKIARKKPSNLAKRATPTLKNATTKRWKCAR